MGLTEVLHKKSPYVHCSSDREIIGALSSFLLQPSLSLSTFIYFSTPVAPLAGKKLGFTIDCGKLHNISLGQGQEIVAEKAIETAAKHGHWVILQVSVKQYN